MVTLLLASYITIVVVIVGSPFIHQLKNNQSMIIVVVLPNIIFLITW